MGQRYSRDCGREALGGRPELADGAQENRAATEGPRQVAAIRFESEGVSDTFPSDASSPRGYGAHDTS